MGHLLASELAGDAVSALGLTYLLSVPDIALLVLTGQFCIHIPWVHHETVGSVPYSWYKKALS